MLRPLVIFMLSFHFPIDAYAVAQESKAFSETIESTQGSYSILVEPKSKKVEVVRIKEKSGAPPYLRLRVHRKEKRPLEVRLRAIDREESPLRYSGKITD